jgi:hypothetical protein
MGPVLITANTYETPARPPGELVDSFACLLTRSFALLIVLATLGDRYFLCFLLFKTVMDSGHGLSSRTLS